MPDVPTRQPTARLRDHTDAITDAAQQRETGPDSDYEASSLQTLVNVIYTADPTLPVWVGKAGDHATPPFVKIDPLTSVSFGVGLGVECYGRIHDRFQVSFYAADAASALNGRNDVHGWIEADGTFELADDDFAVFPDESVHPDVWIALFAVREAD